MYCKICGSALSPNDTFCKNCGATVTNNQPNEGLNQSSNGPVNEPIFNSNLNNASNEPIRELNSEVHNDLNMNRNEESVVIPPAPAAEQLNNFEANPSPVQPIVEQVPVEPNHIENVAPSLKTEETINNQKEVALPVTNDSPDNSEEPKKDDKSGKFLVILGAIIGILAVTIIVYLIYSSASKNNNSNNNDIKVTTQADYTVTYADTLFTLKTNMVSHIDDGLILDKKTWQAKIKMVASPLFSKLTAENIAAAYADLADYEVSEIAQKTYNGLACFTGNVDYADNAKTVVLLCNRAAGGYWYIEIGEGELAAYPTSDIIKEFTKIVAEAKEYKEENKLKISQVEINVEETEPVNDNLNETEDQN